MYKEKISAAVPFTDFKIYANRDIFLEQGMQVITKSIIDSRMNGHAYNFESSKVIKASIGEWIERYSLINNKFEEEDLLEAFDLIKGNKINVPAPKVLIMDGEDFNDSCGISTHLNSDDVIKSAFYEFFERQTLVYRWLTKTSGKVINVNMINDNKIKTMYKKLYNFVDQLYLFDISLHHNIHVILAIGYSDYYKAIGLSADISLKNAITSSLEEFYQTFGESWNKRYLRKAGITKKQPLRNSSDVYKEYYNKIDPKTFESEYKFLIENCEGELSDVNNYMDIPFSEVLKNISEDLNLELYCCYIPCSLENLKTKMVKVFSPNGYPHMLPEVFTKEETHVNFGKGKRELPNQYNRIPFP